MNLFKIDMKTLFLLLDWLIIMHNCSLSMIVHHIWHAFLTIKVIISLTLNDFSS